VPLLTLLRKFAPVQKTLTATARRTLKEAAARESEAMEEDEGNYPGNTNNNEPPTPMSDAGEVTVTMRSEDSIKEKVLEADLLFIMYARDTFKRYDRDESNHVSAAEVQGCFTFFNVYMSVGHVVKVMAMFLRDTGNPSQMDERKNVLRFSQFTSLLMQVDRYSLNMDHDKNMYEFFISIPPSERWDVGARWVFPVLIALQFVVLYGMLAAI